jgi:hypothetical protein
MPGTGSSAMHRQSKRDRARWRGVDEGLTSECILGRLAKSGNMGGGQRNGLSALWMSS